MQIKLKYGASDPDFQFYLSSNRIDLFKVVIKNPSSRTLKLMFRKTEYLDGNKSNVDTIANWKYNKLLNIAPKDSLQFSVLTSHITKDSLRFNFNYSGGSFYTHSSKLDSEMYSLRDAQESHGIDKKISSKSISPILACTQPYPNPNNPNMFHYCPITAEGVEIPHWYNHYGIKHYVIFDLTSE